MHQICDWAKYHRRHSSISIWVIKMSFCQNDSKIGESFWKNNSLVTHICTFWTMPITIFSPVANLMHHPQYIWSYNWYDKKNRIHNRLLQNLDCQGNINNIHNRLYIFYAGKAELFTKKILPVRLCCLQSIFQCL